MTEFDFGILKVSQLKFHLDPTIIRQKYEKSWQIIRFMIWGICHVGKFLLFLFFFLFLFWVSFSFWVGFFLREYDVSSIL